MALATAAVNLASGGSQQDHADAVSAADAGKQAAQRQASSDFGTDETAASGARRIAAADADLLFAQQRGDADVDWVTAAAGAYETYLIAEATAHATRVNQIAAAIADSSTTEADTYASAMQALATTAPSPWATLESDQAAARRDRMAAEATASVARVGTTSDAWRDYQVAQAIALKVHALAFVESERELAVATATAARDRAVSESDAEIALAATGHYSGELPNSLGTLTSSFSTPAASSEHYTQLISGSGIGPEGGPVFAPPVPQPRVGGDQLDISKFNPTDPSQVRDDLGYVEMTRRWMETRGDRAEQYVEFREQQERQASGDSSWLYEAKQRGKQQALAEVKRQNRRSTWGFVFNLREIVPAGSQADNYLAAAEEAVAAAQLQGQLNAVNGLTNILVEGFNTSMYVMFGVPTTALTNFVNTAAGEAVLPT
ncbi:MAG: hypothetical protein J5I93_28730, partial [Pirellulaceae bacterium]|nr:hypothetical protein [Pirellulaceae bacterium]